MTGILSCVSLPNTQKDFTNEFAFYTEAVITELGQRERDSDYARQAIYLIMQSMKDLTIKRDLKNC